MDGPAIDNCHINHHPDEQIHSPEGFGRVYQPGLRPDQPKCELDSHTQQHEV